jgi:hypothetical protein
VAYISDCFVHGVKCIGNEVSSEGIVSNHIHGRRQEAGDVVGDRVRIGHSRVLVTVDVGSIGNGLAGSLVLKPIDPGATISSRMSVPLDAITRVQAIAEVPSGTIEGLLVADLAGDRSTGGGGLEMAEKRRRFVSFRIWRRRIMLWLGLGSGRRGRRLSFNSSNHDEDIFLKSSGGTTKASVSGSGDFIVLNYSGVHEILTNRKGSSIKAIDLIVNPLSPWFGLFDVSVHTKRMLDTLSWLKGALASSAKDEKVI